MIKKLFLAAMIGLGLCCTTSCYEEHTDYVIEWSIMLYVFLLTVGCLLKVFLPITSIGGLDI